MGCFVSEAKERCSVNELRDWVRFYQEEPFGDERDDLRIGYATASLAQVILGAWVKNPPRLKPRDFIPQLGEPQQQDPAAIFNVFKSAYPQGMVDKDDG